MFCVVREMRTFDLRLVTNYIYIYIYIYTYIKM